MIKAVFADIDDTLLSFSGFVQEALRSGFQKYGLKPCTPDMFPVFQKINDSLWRRLERGEITLDQLKQVRFDLIFKALDIDFDGQIFEAYFRDQLFLSAIKVDGADGFLKYLSGKYILCAASNGPYEQQMNRLKIAGMTDYFKWIFISSKVGVPKPEKGFFDYCFRTLHESGLPDLKPDETILIGDSLTSDIAGGMRYGMHTCLYQEEPALLPEGVRPDLVIHSLCEIKDVL